MNKVISVFLDRLAERFTALLAGSMSARIEGLHAAAQAEQQSQLEDLARKYEADGKLEIAATLRERAVRLTSADLAAEAVEVIQRVTDDPMRLIEPVRATPQADLRGLPDFTNPGPAAGKKRRKPLDGTDPSDDTGAGS